MSFSVLLKFTGNQTDLISTLAEPLSSRAVPQLNFQSGEAKVCNHRLCRRAVGRPDRRETVRTTTVNDAIIGCLSVQPLYKASIFTPLGSISDVSEH